MLMAEVYVVPRGYVGTHPVTEINNEDAQWFLDNNIIISIEQLNDPTQVVVYARTEADVDGENEIVVLANGRSCQETMAQLRTEAEIKFT